MYELDRTRTKTRVKKLNGKTHTVLETNGRNCIVQDADGNHWMSVSVAGGVDLYPMRTI
jgi:hypothetical protein